MNQNILFLSKIILVLLISVTFGFGGAFAEPKKFDVEITHPENGGSVGKKIIVKGTALIPTGNYLWLLVRHVDFAPLWWPQRQVKPNEKDHKWKAVAYLGIPDDIGSDFDIGVITVDVEGHNDLMAYWEKASMTGDWRPIRIQKTTSPPRIVTVTKVSH